MTKILKIVAFMALLHCGFTSSRVISTLYALHYGQPAWMVGVILSTYAAIPALISIHVGKFIDKIGVRIPITVSFLMISAACLMPILFPYEQFGFWPIIVTSLLAGTGFVFTLISGQGLIGHLSNNKNRATAFTYQSIAFSISGSTGPVVAGYLIDHGSYYWAFGGALTFALLGGGIFLLQARGLPSAFNKSQSKDNRHHSAFELFKDEKVRNVLLASAFVSMAWDLQAFMIPVYGTEIGLDAVAIGWLLSTFSICTFAVRVFMPILSQMFKEWSIIIFVMISAGLTYIVFPFTTSLTLLFLLCGWLGASLGASQPNVLSLLHQVTPDGRVGEAIGIRTMLMNASHAILPLLFGFGGSVIGAASAFWATGALMVGAGAKIGYSVRNMRDPAEKLVEDKAIEQEENIDFKKNDK